MQKAYLAATIAAMTGAMSLDDLILDLPDINDGKPQPMIVYPDGRTNEIRVSRELYPAVFKWPKNSPRCGATMISPQMALTAAHCVSQGEDMAQNLNMQIELTDGDGNFNTYDITDIRANECWWTESGGNRYAADIAFLVLDRPIDCGGDCIEGYHYLKYWDTDIDGDITGSTFVLAGWGASGEI